MSETFEDNTDKLQLFEVEEENENTFVPDPEHAHLFVEHQPEAPPVVVVDKGPKKHFGYVPNGNGHWQNLVSQDACGHITYQQRVYVQPLEMVELKDKKKKKGKKGKKGRKPQSTMI